MNLDKALEYAKNGIRVFPCKPDTKAPRTQNGFKDATTNTTKIRRWWNRHPDDLIGGLCDDTFTVIDVDCGGVCPQEQKDIILSVVDRLRQEGIITNSTPAVRTKSGGFHFYLKTTDSFSRKINYLPAIDILARGGYVILPDEETYTTISSTKITDDLEPLNLSILSALHDEYDFTRKEVKYYIDLAKGKKPRKPRKSKPKKGATTNEADGDESMYQKSDTVYDIDPTASILDENGMIHIDAYMLNTTLLNVLFFNQEIQTKLGKWLGLRVPSKIGKKGTLGYSVLVGHADNNPSMGVRWAEVDSHLIARDFSDHYGDGATDYNVVRLYMNKMYGRNIRRPSKTEWTIWFLRMMHEAGIINGWSTANTPPNLEDIFGKKKQKIKAAEGIFLLDGLKRMHENYSDKFPMSKKFMKAWNKGTHENTSYQAMKELIAAGTIKHTGSEQITEKKTLHLYTIIIDDNKDLVKSEEEAKEEMKARRTKKSLPEIIKERKTKGENMSKLSEWLQQEGNDDDPVDMDFMDSCDGGDWDDIEWEWDDEDSELNTATKDPPS